MRKLAPTPLPAITAEVLKIHAWRRNVSLSMLVGDILSSWVDVVTDYEQALFKELLPARARAPRPVERWPGYLGSIGLRRAVNSLDPVLAPSAAEAAPAVHAAKAPQSVPPPAAPEPAVQVEQPLPPEVVPAIEEEHAPEPAQPPQPIDPGEHILSVWGRPRIPCWCGFSHGPAIRGDAQIRGFEPEPDEERARDLPTAADFPLPNSARSVPREALPEHMQRHAPHMRRPQADPTKPGPS